MPVPISTTTTTTTTSNSTTNQNEFYSKSSTNTDNLTSMYKDLLKNNSKNNKQTLSAQIYFRNYIQESLRFLREKAKEHEAKLRNQISNTATTTVTSFTTSLTTNTTNTSQLGNNNNNNNNQNKSLKIVKIQTNKRNMNVFKQMSLNNKNNNKSMIINKTNNNQNDNNDNNCNNNSNDLKETKSNDNLDDLAKKILIVKPAVTNKCKLNESKLLVKQILCTNKKPQIVRIVDGQSTTKKIKQNAIKLNCDKNQHSEENSTKTSNQEINKDSQTTNTNTPSSDMFYVKNLNRSVECLDDFNDFLRTNISYSHYCSAACHHPHRNGSNRHRSKHMHPCGTQSRSRYIDVDWEAENEKHLRRYERDASERYCSVSNRHDHRRGGTCTHKSRSKSKYRPDQPEETRSKVIIDEVCDKKAENKNEDENHFRSFSPEIPVEKTSTIDKKKRDKSLSILSKSSFGNSNYTHQEAQTKSNTTIAVQTTPSDLSIDAINESPYVKELKAQLETLKAEIARLQNAQSNLEKTLKQQSAVIRPIIYTGYSDQNDYGGYSFDQFIQTDYKLQNEQLAKEMSAAMSHSDQFAMMLPEGAEYYAQNNQPFIYEASNAQTFDEAIRSQLSQQMNLVNLANQNKSTHLKSTDSKTSSTYANPTNVVNNNNTNNNSTTTTTSNTPSTGHNSNNNQNNHISSSNEEPNKLKQTILNKIDTDLKLKKNNTQPFYVSNNIVTPHPDFKQQQIIQNHQQQQQQNQHQHSQQNNSIKYAQSSKNLKRPEEYEKYAKYSVEPPPSIVVSSHSAPVSTNVPPPPPLQGPPSPNAQLYQKLLKLISSSSSYSEQINSQMNTLLSNPNIKAQLKQLHSQLLKNPSQYLPQLENILLDKSPSPQPTQPLPVPPLSTSSQPNTHVSYNSVSNNNNPHIPKHLNDDSERAKVKKNTLQSYENYNKNQQNVYYEEAYHPQSSTQDLLDLRQYYAKDEVKRMVNSTPSSAHITTNTSSYNGSISKNHLPSNLTQRSLAREFKHH